MRKLVLLLVLIASPAGAVDLQFAGYGELRITAPPDERSYGDGGLGKLRYGDDDAGLRFGDFVGQGRAVVLPELTLTATARADDYGVDLLDAYLRYRPVSTNQWRWSLKAGAFFPPTSLENDQLGWSSFWTITPSAINSWIGEELRVIGAEATLEWRREGGEVQLSAAVFGWNDPAGVMIADRGWTFDDRFSGLFQRSRLPDAAAFKGPPPVYARLFTEMDGRPGWYVDVSWAPDDIGGFEVMYYDNEADPTVIKGGQVAWETRFWDIGFEKQLGKLTLLAQGLTGSTTIEPSAFFHQTTDFRSAYALIGYDMDKWWAAARFDIFDTRTRASFPSTLNEDGRAFTLSLSYLPKNWLRFTGELLAVDDSRDERAKPHQTETQLQLLARVYF